MDFNTSGFSCTREEMRRYAPVPVRPVVTGTGAYLGMSK
jgi:hypothetical protein